MSEKNLPITGSSDNEKLKLQIDLLQKELEDIQKEIRSFETILHSHLSDLIIEKQELFILYKHLKKEKKTKRLEQKKRGKNYKVPKGLQLISEKKKCVIPSDQEQEKKRLYREALLHVHPDKFNLDEKENDIATEVTTRLIEIYKTEDLATLQAFHAHIFNGHTQITLSNAAAKIEISTTINYLAQTKERLEKDIALAKNNQLYKVVTEYENPLTYVDELKQYYKYKIIQLKKRTRKAPC